jgi:hypothetical protein
VESLCRCGRNLGCWSAGVLGCWDVGISVKTLCCWGGRLFSTEVADTAGFGLRECGASFRSVPPSSVPPSPQEKGAYLSTPRIHAQQQPRLSKPEVKASVSDHTVVVPPAGPPSWESQRPFQAFNGAYLNFSLHLSTVLTLRTYS